MIYRPNGNRAPKLFVLMLAALLLLSSGCVTPSPVTPENGEPELSVMDLYPMAEGNYWRYEGSGSEYADFDEKVLYAADGLYQLISENSGTVSVTVYEMTAESLNVIYSAEEFYDERNILEEASAAGGVKAVLIRTPLEEGASWVSGDREYEIFSMSEEVETPAGLFAGCVLVKSHDEENTYTTEAYYCPGTGLVKQVFKSGEGYEVSSVLAEYLVN